MTKISPDQIICPDLLTALDRAKDNAYSSLPCFPPHHLMRIRTPKAWFNNVTTVQSITGIDRCDGCGGKCNKRVRVDINFKESDLVDAEKYPDRSKTKCRVFHILGSIQESIRVSGHPCLKDDLSDMNKTTQKNRKNKLVIIG